MNIDPEDQTPLGQKLIELYTKISHSVEQILLESDWDDLQILKLIYGDALIYPIHEHIDRIVSEVPDAEETIH